MSGRSKTQQESNVLGHHLLNHRYLHKDTHALPSPVPAHSVCGFEKKLCAGQAPMRSFGGLFSGGQEQLGAVEEGLQPYQPEWAGTSRPLIVLC